MDTPSLRTVADGVWMASTPVRIVGMRLATNMTVLDLGAGELVLVSPVPMTPTLRAAVDELGRVAHLYAPNTFHHLWLGEWAAAYRDARVHAPAALAKKRPDLRVDRAHDCDAEPAFAGVIDEHPVRGFRLAETVLRYRPASALVVADLVHHVGRPTDLWTALYTRVMGFHDRVAISRAIRWTAFSDRRAARRSLDAILEHDVETLVVGHGEPITRAPRDALRDAYAWLRPTDALVRVAPRRPAPGACG